MRKALAAILLLLILGSAAVYIFLRFTRKPVPTPRAWHASVLTVAGDGSPATFADPFGVAIADDGSVYVSDAGEKNRIQKISPEGSVTTLAGGSEGFADGTGAQASFNTPSGLAIDSEGNLYVADTGNNRIRKVTPQGVVTTLAGDATAGHVDGAAAQARFNGPIGVAVDSDGNVYVADTYNDRIRKISKEGQVTTIAANEMFDTPCGVAVASDGSIFVADTGNNQVRKITRDGNVTTLAINHTDLSRPVGLAITHDDLLYVTELGRARVIQVTPDNVSYTIASEFSQPSGVAVHPKTMELYVTDSGKYLVRKLVQQTDTNTAAATHADILPKITNETLGQQSLLWPLAPQQSPHEVVATMGEVRGSFDSTDSRDHLHSGLDVFGAYGETVVAVRDEKVSSPLPNWGFDSLNEGMRVGVVSYIHMHVGRDKDGKMFTDPRFIQVNDGEKVVRVRIKRGTRFRVGEALGTVNKMYHVHMNIGPPGGEVNPLSLSPLGFSDDKTPTIESVQLFDGAGSELKKQSERYIITGNVRIVVDAYDRTNMNPDRRRLGLYKLGYQLLNVDGSPAQGFAEPRITILFNRLPADDAATKVAYAGESGITVYGSAKTRFLYEVTNTVKDGVATPGIWDTSQLPKGDYVLRIIAADYSGNQAQDGRDLKITVK
ncbi:MAG TPA: NHL repeat-containing protein [Pyrinomonadaceae bacterium]|jgi:sugar lactone lactonase YvrE|nr:NHL repeat-containing protein [Pyrinomonadaceae bacterium]